MNANYVISFLTFCVVVDTKIYRSIVWSPDNPVFKESPLKCVLPKSMQYLLCPSLSLIVSERDKQPSKENLFENIWLVDEQSYNDCKVNSAGRLLKMCNTPLTLSRFDILFIDMHPLSDGLEFKFGKMYYFIATSNGTESSLNNKEGGHCKTFSMKLAFYVCKDDSDPYCQSDENCQSLLDTPTVLGPVINSPTVTKQPLSPKPTTNEPTKPCNTTKREPTIPYETVPPYSGHYCSSFEVFYRLGISLLGIVCIVFISSTLFLAVRFYRFSKIHTDCRSKYTAQISYNSNGSPSTDNECARVLVNMKDTDKNV